MTKARMKKYVAILVVLALFAVVLAGCSNPGQQVESPNPGSSDPVNSEEVNQGNDVTFEVMTIGVYSFDWTSSPYSEWKAFLTDYVGEYYNIEFIFSTESGDAEGEKTFMEKMGAVGAAGVMAVSTYSLDNCLTIASQYQMYYLTMGMTGTDLSTFSEEQLAYYAGECGTGNSSRSNGGYELAMETVKMLDTSKKMTIKMVGLNPAAGLPPIAPPLLQQSGVQSGIDEMIADGMDIDFEFVYVAGFSAEAWATATDNALALIGNTENAALICGSLDYSIQPILNAGMQDKVIVAGFSGVQEGIAPYFNDGTVNLCIDFGYSCAFPANGFIQLYNAVTGHRMMGDDGYPARVEMVSGILVNDVATYNAMIDHSYEKTGNTYYTHDVMNQYISICNPDVTVGEFTDFVNATF